MVTEGIRFMQAFWLSLFMIFIAELGDKTQLVALTLATRYNSRVVLAGVFVATLVVHIFSSLLGTAVGAVLPEHWIKYSAGIAFIVFGLWTLHGDSLDGREGRQVRFVCPFWVVATTFFLAELGDKTMLSTVTLATTGGWIAVWLGSTVGMVLSDALAIWVGRVLGRRLPERQVSIFAAGIFFFFGLYSIVGGIHGVPPWAWAGGLAVLAGTIYLLFVRRAGCACKTADCELSGQTDTSGLGLRKFCNYCILRSPCCNPEERGTDGLA